jgi:hypothetical protein
MCSQNKGQVGDTQSNTICSFSDYEAGDRLAGVGQLHRCHSISSVCHLFVPPPTPPSFFARHFAFEFWKLQIMWLPNKQTLFKTEYYVESWYNTVHHYTY